MLHVQLRTDEVARASGVLGVRQYQRARERIARSRSRLVRSATKLTRI